MTTRAWQIGIVGTFDVENYGDLLFPLIAEAELTERLGLVEFHRFSYHAKHEPDWPFEVTSVADLPAVVGNLDGLLIGGGFLIRFDKDVAPAYAPPDPTVHHPTGYWLTPALMALQHDVPVIWNAPGMHCNEIPAWADPLMELAFGLSSHTAVRDEPSRDSLLRFAEHSVAVLPDTGFGIARLLDRAPSPEFERLHDLLDLSRPYIVVQAALSSERFVRFAQRHASRFENHQFISVPIGPVLGDEDAIVAELPGVATMQRWPRPPFLAELIRGAEAVVGHSYHLAITALVSGVPVFTPEDLSIGKYTGLSCFEAIFPLFDGDDEPDVDRFLSRVGRHEPPAELNGILEQLATHWNRVAEIIQEKPSSTVEPMNRFWQRLPGVLEAHAICRVATLDELNVLEAEVSRQAATIETLRVNADEQAAIIEALQADAALQATTIDALETHRSRLAATVAAVEANAFRQVETIVAMEAARAHDEQRIQELRRVIATAGDAVAERNDALAAIRVSCSQKVTSPLRRRMATTRSGSAPARDMLALSRLLRARLERHPYAWGIVDHLLAADDAARLVATFPHDHFKSVSGYGGEKDYEYEARELVAMGASIVSHGDELDESWRRLAEELTSPAYRMAMSVLTGRDLSGAPLEVNVFHYGPGASLGPHADLPDKIATHVWYFNRSWDPNAGGCLRILGSADHDDLVMRVTPDVDHSVVLVRSDESWHAVDRVVNDTGGSRRSLTATFYQPGSTSTLWPSGDAPAPDDHAGRAND